VSPRATEADERFMRLCLRLAARGRGHVSPNPLVGAVLVRKGRVVARGWHRRFGGPHAEVDCLRKARGRLREATLYVNLEPCAHYGKTPPCTERIIAAGIGSVVIGMRDPNPLVAGRGIRMLKGAGIRVRAGVLEEEAKELNRFFTTHITRSTPYVHVKVAQSIDGFIGGERAPRYLSSPASLRLVHRWRAEYDAVLVGAGTVRTDNPRLTVRHHRGRDPHVVIIDGELRVPESANVLKRDQGRGVFLCVSEGAARRHAGKVQRLEGRGIAVLRFRSRGGLIPLNDVLHQLYRFSIGSILVEGGSNIFNQFVRGHLADELSVFVTPMLLGKGVPAFALCDGAAPAFSTARELHGRTVGKDMLFSARLRRGE